jgi:hypothetical protein
LDAENKIRRLTSIVEGVGKVLNQYSNLWRQDSSRLGPIIGHIEICYSALKQLEDELTKQYKKIPGDGTSLGKKVKSEKISALRKLTWVAWARDSAQVHLQDIEAAKSSLSMSFAACEA